MPRMAARISLEDALRFTCDHVLPFGVGHAHGQVVAGDARVIHQNVNAAHCIGGRFYQPGHRLWVRQVARHDIGAFAQLGCQGA